ncbi:hypothetical protein IKE88_02135 [Candidatus Saccharibacteria bacterium]|nr:hypothetical protein [Candidatus Saccharibacteria bacterium]
MSNTRLIKTNSDNKRHGCALRCVPGISSPLVALVQDLIHCRMYMLATITGLRVGFTTRR